MQCQIWQENKQRSTCDSQKDHKYELELQGGNGNFDNMQESKENKWENLNQINSI